jgi:hypothetical protein
MSEFDHELRRLLSRREPPAGFAERVLGRTEPAVPPVVRPALRPRSRFVRWAAAAALVAAAAGVLEYRERRREQAAGEAARDQVVQALQLAGSKLQLVQAKINRLHEPSRNP